MPVRPPLSIVLATTDPWPDLANCLSVLVPQAGAIGAEILVGDAHGEALDERYVEEAGCLTWIRMPGASVFQLRAAAAERATGEIIATTEDHCVVSADWCAEVLRGFALHPKALALSGPILNGSRDRLIDWANYIHTFGSSLPPYDRHDGKRCPPNANVAYRRSAFPSGALPPGWMELELNPDLFRQGLTAFHEPLAVTHVQSHGFWGTVQAHFDNGRSTTGLHPIPFSNRQLPWVLYRATVRAMGGWKHQPREIRASKPLVFLLSCCHAFGETVGILAGPGNSPARLR